MARVMAACTWSALASFLLMFSCTACLPTTKEAVCHIHQDHLESLHNTHHFNCSVIKGDVASEIVWKINGSIVKKSHGPIHWLGLELKDKAAVSGILRCEAKTKDCDVACETSLTGFPRITTRISFYDVYIGNRLVVPCKTTGVPQPRLTWTKRDKNLAKSTMPQFVTLKKSRDNLDLVIDEASMMHSGIYMCQAVNRLGKDTHLALITVLYHARFVPPRVVPIQSNITVRNGDKAIISCSTKYTPEKYTALYWDHDETRIRNFNRFQQKQTFSFEIHQGKYKVGRAMMSLVIKQVSLKDAGVYRCGAVTHVGHGQAHVDLIVKE